MKALTTATLLAATLVLAACGDKAQTAGTPKADGKPWETEQTAFSAQGWKAGDKAAWENQLKARSQGQNEYSRAPAQP
jgi:major membrane immunogen (membrane-anchored lipoprotein)